MRIDDFNPKALLWHMQELKISSELLAQKLNLSSERVKEFLEDTPPSLNHLAKLCAVLGVDLDQLRTSNAPSVETPSISFRRLQSNQELGYRARWEIRNAQRLRDAYIRLGNFYAKNTSFYREECPQSLAQYYSRIWNWRNLREKELKKGNGELNTTAKGLLLRARLQIESLEILTFTTNYHHKHKIPLQEFRGLLIEHEAVPVVLLNYHDHPSAKLFTLLHEFAHVLYAHLPDDNKTETICNKFAAEFLVPEKELHQLVKNNPNISVDLVSQTFGVSRYCAAYAMYQARWISKVDLDQIRSQSSQFKSSNAEGNGGRHSHRNQFLATSPSLWKLALSSYDSGLIGPTTFAEVTGFATEKSLNHVYLFQKRDQW